MTAEPAGQTGLVASDGVTRDFLKAVETWQRPAGAVLDIIVFDASELAPQVAAPYSPANAGPVDQFRDVQPTLAYIGACTGAKLEDLCMASRILRGGNRRCGYSSLRRAARDQETAEWKNAESVCGRRRRAAATVRICAGYGEHLLPENMVAISSTARNFKGRMGAASSQVYLASPYTVAATAVAGRVCDPREFLR